MMVKSDQKDVVVPRVKCLPVWKAADVSVCPPAENPSAEMDRAREGVAGASVSLSSVSRSWNQVDGAAPARCSLAREPAAAKAAPKGVRRRRRRRNDNQLLASTRTRKERRGGGAGGGDKANRRVSMNAHSDLESKLGNKKVIQLKKGTTLRIWSEEGR